MRKEHNYISHERQGAEGEHGRTLYGLVSEWASLVAQLVENLPATWETWVWSLGWEDPLEKGKATHSSILAPIQPMGSQRGRHNFHFLLFSEARFVFATVLYCIHWQQVAVLFLGHMSQSTSPVFSPNIQNGNFLSKTIFMRLPVQIFNQKFYNQLLKKRISLYPISKHIKL